MKIINVPNNISFQSKFVNNPILQTLSESAKKNNSNAGLIATTKNIVTNTKQTIQETLTKTVTEIENLIRGILNNNPKSEELLNIVRSSKEECQKALLELLKYIKLTDDKLSDLLKLFNGNFPKEPEIAKVWGLCIQNGLNTSTLLDSTYSIDEKCAKNILEKKLIDKFKSSPEQALLMSRFDSDKTINRVSEFAQMYWETDKERRISKLPFHDDKLTNAILDLITKFKNLVNRNDTDKRLLSGYYPETVSYWTGSPFKFEDIISKIKILDIIDKKTESGGSLYYATDILNKTEAQTEITIANILQRYDISLKTANKIVLSMKNKINDGFISSICSDKSLKIKPESIPNYIKIFDLLYSTSLDSANLKITDKINILKELKSVPQELKPIYSKHGYNIDSNIDTLNKMLGEKVPLINVPKDIQQGFISAFLTNNNPAGENIIKTHDFTQYGNNGIPLKYTRKDFCKNLNELLSLLNKEEQSELLKHFGLSKGENYTDGTVSYNGILNNKKFEVNNLREEVYDVANRIFEEIEKFTIKNESLFEDVQLKQLFDSIIKGCPEFTFAVGKERQGANQYSVDIHTLNILQNSMNNPLYSTLSDTDKTVLKMSVLLHDLGISGSKQIKVNEYSSTKIAEAILGKLKLTSDVKDRITELIQNFNWFTQYNTGILSVEDVAVRCRRPGDLKIYEIIAMSDTERINKNFQLYDKFAVPKTQAEFNKYIEEKMMPVKLALNQIYARHNPVFYTRFTGNGKLFPIEKVKIDNEIVELRVLDLNKLPDNASLEQYGFPKGTTKENVRFLVNMTRPNIANLESVIYLTKNRLNHSTWSMSLIKPSDNVTYENYNYGYAFFAEQANFADAFFENIASGNNKTLESFRDKLFGKILHYDLNKIDIDLTQEERRQLAKIIIEKGYLQNINEDIIIGNKTINKKQVFDACGGDSWLYLRDIMLENLKREGFSLSDKEYADLTEYLLTKKSLTQITKPNLKGELTGEHVKVGKHSIPAKTLVDCLNRTLERLFDGGHVQSEVIVLDPVPAALLAKEKRLEDCHHDFLVTAKKYKDTIPVIIMENK